MDKMVKRILESRGSRNLDRDEVGDISSEILQVIHDKFIKVMTSSSFGFSADEVDDYSKIDVYFTTDHTGREYLVVEVRAEVSYSGLLKLSEVLDPIVQYYDREAYFEPVTSGIITAYLRVSELKKFNESTDRKDEAINTYIKPEDKVSVPKLKSSISSYPVGTYIRYSTKGAINAMSNTTYGVVKTEEGWVPYSSFSGANTTGNKYSDTELLALMRKRGAKTVGVKLPRISSVTESRSNEVDSDLIFNLRKLRTEATEALYKYEQLGDIGECKAILQYLVKDSKSTLDYISKM